MTWLWSRVRSGFKLCPTEATGGLWGRRLTSSGRPTADTIIRMMMMKTDANDDSAAPNIITEIKEGASKRL